MGAESPPTKIDNEVRKPIVQKRRWVKFLELGACAIGVIVAILIILALNPRIIGSIVAGRMGDTAGGTVTIDSFEWTGWNTAEIKGVHLTAPDWTGPGSEVLRIDRLRINIDMLSLAWGPTKIKNLEIDGIQLNVVEDPKRSSVYNFQSLRRGVGIAPKENPVIVDRAALREVSVSFQRIKANKAVELLRVIATADLAPSPFDPSHSRVEIRQVDGPVHLDGWWDQKTLAFDVSAAGMRVNDNLGLIMPRTLRALVENADAAGTVKSATLSAAPGKPIHGKMELADFRATLPIDVFESWVRYENGTISAARGYPQVKLRTGTIELTGTKLEFRNLDFELDNTAADARVATLPVRASLSLDFAALLTKEFDWEERAKWAQEVRDFAPFDLEVSVPNFSLGQSAENAAIEVPRSVAEFMKTFAATEITSTARATASRAAPTTAADGSFIAQPVVSFGQLDITDGRGAFEDFPYPLTKIQSTIRFLGMNARIVDLHGMGSGGQNVVLTGDITNMGPTAGVTLTITSESAPIDSTLFNSFPKRESELLSSLFWQNGFKSLQAAGMLFDQSQVTDAAAELAVSENRLSALTTDGHGKSAEIAALATRAGQLRRIIDHGSFTPGGRLALALKVSRPESSTSDAVVTGTIRILSADILPTTFPYPVRAKGGEIVLSEDQIDFGAGVQFETFDGAQGLFKGQINLRTTDGVRTVDPNLEFSLTNDQLSPLFFMAIPPGINERVVGWPGESLSSGGTILSQLDPRGTLSLDGKIGLTKSGQLDVACNISLQRGSIHPSIPAEKILATEGLFWPVGFGLDDCSGSFRLADNAVVVKSFTGFRREGRIDATGRLSLDGTSTDVAIQLDNIQLAEYAINLIPFGDRERAAAVWKRYRPTGRFDADITLKTPVKGGPISTSVTVTPKLFGITLPDGPLQAIFDSGTLTVENKHIRCDALSGSIGPVGGLSSHICVDGSYGTDSGGLDLNASIEDGLIHGPLIGEVVDRIDAGGLTSFLNEYKPEGRYDAQISYSIPPGSTVGSFELDAWITQFSLGNAANRLALGFDTPAHINARGDSLTVDPFRAVFPGGSIEACGWLASNKAGVIDDGEFGVNLHAIGTGGTVIGALPAAAREPLTSIEFECRDILKANMVLRLSRPKDIPHIEIQSDVAIHGASIHVGPSLSHFSADLNMHIATDAQTTSFDASVTDAQLALAGHKLTNVSAVLRKSGESPDFFVKSFRGSLGTGLMGANAQVKTTAPFHYETDMILSSVPLSALILPNEGVDTTAAVPSGDPGLVDARITIEGDASGISTRLGRGSASIQKAELAKLPIGVALLQITQFSLSLNPVVQRGDFEFTIDQDQLQFQKFDLTCKDVLLFGEGWLNTESTELALRLRNRGTMPIISDILGGVTNQLFQIDVRGTLSEPIGSLAPLPGLTTPPQLAKPAPIASNQP